MKVEESSYITVNVDFILCPQELETLLKAREVINEILKRVENTPLKQKEFDEYNIFICSEDDYNMSIGHTELKQLATHLSCIVDSLCN